MVLPHLQACRQLVIFEHILHRVFNNFLIVVNPVLNLFEYLILCKIPTLQVLKVCYNTYKGRKIFILLRSALFMGNIVQNGG